MKKYGFITILLSLLLLLMGCKKVTYKNDVPSSGIVAAIREQIPVPSGYEVYDEDFLAFYLPEAVSLVSESEVIYAVAPDDYTEIGVLRARSSDGVEALASAVGAYLEDFRRTYQPQAEQYDPSEREKLKDASYRIYGDYVIYTVMTAKTQETCYGIVDGLLKRE